MKRFVLVLIRLSLSLPLVTLAGTAGAHQGGHPPCVKTAKQMYQACLSDVGDSFATNAANCTNLIGREEGRACLDDARQTRKEARVLCAEQLDARRKACDLLGEFRYAPDPLLDPAISYVDPDEVDTQEANPFISIQAGHTAVMRAGEAGEEIVVVHNTGASREIQGVSCRIVVDAAVTEVRDEVTGDIDYVAIEVTDDWIAQDIDGNVYYCGELSRNYEDGRLDNLDGSFEAGRDFAKAGVLILKAPERDFVHRQEFALGEAEDIIQYVDLAAAPETENSGFPCRSAGGCVKTLDFSPLEPATTEFKYYLAGVGLVLAEPMEDGVPTGELETLMCAGDSLSVLEQDECGVEDPAKLLKRLCELAPQAFCD